MSVDVVSNIDLLPPSSSEDFVPEWSSPSSSSSNVSKWITVLPVFLLTLVMVRHFQITMFSRTAKMLTKFPTVPYLNLPFIHHTYIFARNSGRITEMFEEAVRKFGKGGKMIYMWHIGVPHLLVADPKVAEKILMSTTHLEKGVGYKWVFEWIINGLIVSSGEKWRHDRKLFNPAFNKGLLDRFLECFDRETKELVEKLGEYFEKDPSVARNLHSDILGASINMVFESALGLDLKTLVKEGELAKAFLVITSATHIKMFKPYLYVTPFVYRLMGREKQEQHTKKLVMGLCALAIEQKKKDLTTNGNQSANEGRRKMKPFLDILVEDKPNISQDEYNQHLITVSGAGSDTTTSSVYNTIFLLAENTHHQAKCQEEIDEILGDDPDRALTPSDLPKVKYLEMCWKEALRMFPPIPAISRTTAHDETLEDGRVIPKGVDCLIDIYHICQDPTLFPNPKEFDPLRFLPDVASKRPTCHYLPFSMGPRNCIGMKFAQLEAMVILIRILSRYRIETDMKAKDLKMVFGVPGKPDKDMLVRLVPRTKC